jgi:hypothetical protein
MIAALALLPSLAVACMAGCDGHAPGSTGVRSVNGEALVVADGGSD